MDAVNWTLDKVDVGQVGNLPGHYLPNCVTFLPGYEQFKTQFAKLRYVFAWLRTIQAIKQVSDYRKRFVQSPK